MDIVERLSGETQLLINQGRHSEAVDVLERACVETLFLLGTVRSEERRFEESEKLFKMALDLNRGHWKAETNYSHLLCKQGRYAEAAESARRAIKFSDANEIIPLYNYSVILSHVHDMEAAKAVFRRAIELRPNDHLIKFNLGALLLQMEDYVNGWEMYEHRLRGFEGLSDFCKRFWDTPMWDGEQDLSGKTLVLFNEQGLGDTIQFVRFIPELQRRLPNTRIVMEVQRTMAEVMRVSLPGVEVVPRTDWVNYKFSDPPAGDACLSVYSIPHRLKLYRNEQLECGPYLTPPAAGPAVPPTGKYRVGFCWAGNSSHQMDYCRSVPLGAFQALSDLPNVQLYSLQKYVTPTVRKWPGQVVDLMEGAAGVSYIDLAPLVEDFSDTGGVLQQLDLIVTIDTALAHFAGAMGRPVWLLTPFTSDWRWGLNRERPVWYPSVTLFRQAQGEPWAAVVGRMAAKLASAR